MKPPNLPTPRKEKLRERTSAEKLRERTSAEKVLDALRHQHPRYRDATPDEIAAALFSAGL